MQLVQAVSDNTTPEQTLRGLADHGKVTPTLAADPAGAERTLVEAAADGIDLPTETEQLEREGIESFCDSYRQLLDCVESKVSTLAGRSS